MEAPVGDYTRLSMYSYRLCRPDDPQEVQDACLKNFLACIMVHPFALTVPPALGQPEYTTKFIPGHPTCSQLMAAGSYFDGLYFPAKSKVMIIGKYMQQDEYVCGVHFSGAGGKLLQKLFVGKSLPFDDIYVTNVLKFCPRRKLQSIPAAWMREALPILQMEIALVQPEFLLILGADALKTLMGKQATLRKYSGRVLDYMGAKALVTNNPSDILRNPDKMPGFTASIQQFVNLVKGKDRGIVRCEYDVLRTEDELKRVVNDLIANNVTKFALDCEWSGENCHFSESHLLTIQFSHKLNHAYVVVLRSDVSGFEFSPTPSKAVAQLSRLFSRPEVEIYGHNFRSDMQWLTHLGLDVRRQFAVNGFDTILADHLLAENIEHDLSRCVLRYTDRGRYDRDMMDAVAEYGGYDKVPDDILWAYGADDAEVVLRLTGILKQLLWREHCRYADEHGLDPDAVNLRGKGVKADEWVPTVWNLYWEVVMKSGLALHEIEMTGILADKDRLVELSNIFDTIKQRLGSKLRDMLGDPDFNLNSFKQVAWMLFGPPEYVDKHGRSHVGLALTPVKSTGKPAQQWEMLIRNGHVKYTDQYGWMNPEHKFSPSTDAESLSVLALDSEEAATLRDYRFIDQVCKTFLRKPVKDALDEEVYDGGIISFCAPDGRIRTTLSQLSETGRLKSSNPNLQNLPKGREGDLWKIFQDMGYDPTTVRSCFIAEPGHVLIEADLESAELYTLAYIARDDNMKEDLNKLDANGNKISLHSVVAVKIFKLPVSVEEFEQVRKGKGEMAKKYDGLRVAAKSVNFGIPYQRSGKAIARAVMREGVDCTEDDGNTWVHEWYSRYKKNAEYIEFCKGSVYDPGYLVTPWGRVRHFYRVSDEAVMAAQQREACNFPIQSTVADTINYAMYRFIRSRDALGLRTRIILTVHDSIVLSAPYEEARTAVQLVTDAMTGIEVPGTGLHYGIDVELFERWCVKCSAEVMEKCNVVDLL